MHPKASFHFALNRIFGAVALILLSATCAWPRSYTVLYNFNNLANTPSSGLISDTAGNGYGTTAFGGHHNAGTVYQLSPSTGAHLVYAFSGPDGRQPEGNLVFDSAGNLYGTTVYGGADATGCQNQGCGTVFKLTPPSNGGPWTETVLYSFTGGSDGASPQAGVILDPAGNVYGTAENGGNGAGVVFQLVPGANNQWTENVLYAFVGGINDGGFPLAGLTLDAAGNLYGTASKAGPRRGGTAFELSLSSGGTWNYVVIYAFDSMSGSTDGFTPAAGLVFDGAGNLYGTTTGGGEFGFGTVFELMPNSGSWMEMILYSLAGGNDGEQPESSVVLDPSGNLYGTTYYGGCPRENCGIVFKLQLGPGGQWTESSFRFPSNGSLGFQPSAPVFLDGAGNVYGTTTAGGHYGRGVVFKIAQ